MPTIEKDDRVVRAAEGPDEFNVPVFLDDFKHLIDKNSPQPIMPGQLHRELQLFQDRENERFSAYDKAILLLQDLANRMPTPAMVQSEVIHLAEMLRASVDSLKQQIESLKTLFDKTGELNNTALQAAFAAAKEAVGAAQVASALANTKMETNFTKQIDGIGILLSTLEKALTSKVDDQEKTLTSKVDDVKVQVGQAVPRLELQSTMGALVDRVSSLEKAVANYQGALVVVGLLCTAIPTIIAILLNFVHR